MLKVKHGEAKGSIWKHSLVPVLLVPVSLLQPGTRSPGCPLPSAVLEGAALPTGAGDDTLPPTACPLQITQWQCICEAVPVTSKPHLKYRIYQLFRAEEEGRI